MVLVTRDVKIDIFLMLQNGLCASNIVIILTYFGIFAIMECCEEKDRGILILIGVPFQYFLKVIARFEMVAFFPVKTQPLCHLGFTSPWKAF